MKLSPVPVRPPLPSNLPTWTAGTSLRPPRSRPRPRWVWPLGTLALLALLGEPQLSLALAVGSGVFWWRRQGKPGGSPTGWMVGTVGLTTTAMVGTYGLLALLYADNFGLMLQILETLALAIALWQQGRTQRRQTQERAWAAAIAQLTHPDDRMRAIALQRLTRWARRGLAPTQHQELAGYCRLLLVRESAPALREAVFALAEVVHG